MSSRHIVSEEAKRMADEITILVAAEINVGRPAKLAVLCERYLRKAYNDRPKD